MARLCDTNLCSGCSACAAVCPQNCITMVQDDEGFRRPKVDAARCAECGLCTRTCPVLSAPETNPMPLAFAAQNREDAVRELSTSGGVFTLLARHTLEQGGVVFGAAYDADFKVEHRMVETPEMLTALRGAKYAQSDLGDTFRQVKEQLSCGRKVLFFTNNASHSHTFYYAKLARLGFDPQPGEIMSSGDVTAAFLNTHRAGKSVYLLGTPELWDEFKRAGIPMICNRDGSLVTPESKPDIVVTSFDTTLTYEKLTYACTFIREGAEYLTQPSSSTKSS